MCDIGLAPERYPGFRIIWNTAPSRAFMAQWLSALYRPAASIPGYSGGTAADSHRIPQAPGAESGYIECLCEVKRAQKKPACKSRLSHRIAP